MSIWTIENLNSRGDDVRNQHAKRVKIGIGSVAIAIGLILLVPMRGKADRLPQTKPPIEKEGLLLALKDRVLSKEKLIREIVARGVDFRVDGTSEKQIRDAGSYLGQRGVQELINAVRSNFKFLILFAEFQTLDKQSHGVTETVINQLRAGVSKYPDTRVEYLGETITAQEGDEVARRKGKERGAHFVIWGWYGVNPVAARVNVHFVFVKGLKSWTLCKKSEEETFTTPLMEIQTYSLKTQITEHMAYLTLFAVGLARLEANDLDEAIARFNAVLSMPNAPNQIIDAADVYRYRAYAFLLKEQYELAIADWDKAIALKPDAWSYESRGLTHHNKGDYALAIADYGRAISLNSKYAAAYYDRGLLHLAKDNYESAISDFTKAIQLEPKRDDLYYARGSAYRGKSDYNAAIADYTKTLELNPTYACAYNNRGVIYEETVKYDLAISDYNKALEVELTDRTLRNRGRVYAIQGKYDLAINDYSSVLRLNPNDAYAYLERGFAYARIGQNKRALSDLMRASNLGIAEEYRLKAETEIKRLMKN